MNCLIGQFDICSVFWSWWSHASRHKCILLPHYFRRPLRITSIWLYSLTSYKHMDWKWRGWARRDGAKSIVDPRLTTSVSFVSSDVATLWLRDTPLAMCAGHITNTLAKKPRWEQTQQKRLRKNNAITTMNVRRF